MSLRRLLLASTLSVAVALPILGCTGSADVAEVGEKEEVERGAGKKKGKKKKADGFRLDGAWRMAPPKKDLRVYMVLDAAVAKNPKKKLKRLGKLSSSEQDLFDSTKKASSASKDAIRQELKFMKGCSFVFKDGKVTVSMGSEKGSAVPYTVVNDSSSETTVTFDPGLGNGVETHRIEWTTKTHGIDHISAGSTTFRPFDISRKGT